VERKVLFGTDQIGRDMLTRLIFGDRNTLGIAIVTTLLAFAVGGTLGILAALLRGWFDQLAARAVDVLMAIPALIFALIPAVHLRFIDKESDTDHCHARCDAHLPALAIRGDERRPSPTSSRLRDFAERTTLAREARDSSNILTPLVAEFGLRFCFVFLTISALSFLAWASSPHSRLGLHGAGERRPHHLRRCDPLLAAAAIGLLTIAVNFVVDWFLHQTSGLRDER